MAEIEIQKKKPVWPWIVLVLILILAAVIYFAVCDDDRDDDGYDPETEQIEDDMYPASDELGEGTNSNRLRTDNMGDTKYIGAGVVGFVNYIKDEKQMGVDHEYTNKALLYLMDAIQERAENINVDISMEMDVIKDVANEITLNPHATDHAGRIKEAGTQVVSALRKMQQKSYPDLAGEVEEVKSAVQEIDPDVLLLDQKENVLSFYDQAAEVLQKMYQIKK